jgi:hypothetical protein
MLFEANGLNGDLSDLVRMERWTATAADCLDIKEMGNIVTVEADDLELEDAGSDSDSDFDSADEAEQNMCFFGFFNRGLCNMSFWSSGARYVSPRYSKRMLLKPAGCHCSS